MVVTWMEGYIGSLEQRGYTVPRHLGGLAGMQLNNIRYIITLGSALLYTVEYSYMYNSTG